MVKVTRLFMSSKEKVIGEGFFQAFLVVDESGEKPFVAHLSLKAAHELETGDVETLHEKLKAFAAYQTRDTKLFGISEKYLDQKQVGAIMRG